MLPQHGSEQFLGLEDDQRLSALPILVLNVHSRCNCRCIMCDIWKREPSTEITAADMERHRESLRRLQTEWVVLSGGEPLMNRDLAGLCAFFRDLGIRLTLLTTGLLLERRAVEVAEFFDDVIISLDGPSHVHDAIRRVKGCYDAIRSGIAAVRALRPGLRISARSTVQKANHAYVNQTAREAKAIGLDEISFLAADVTSEAFNRSLVWPGERQDEIALSAAEIDVLESEMERLISWCWNNPGFVAENPDKLRNVVRHFRAHLGQARFEAPRCNAPWVSAVIEADGTVRPCFFHRPVGSIRNNSLEEVVNGDDARSFRGALDVATNPTCRRCVCSLYREPFRR